MTLSNSFTSLASVVDHSEVCPECQSSQFVENNHGEVVCSACGLVIEKIYDSVNFTQLAFDIDQKKIPLKNHFKFKRLFRLQQRRIYGDEYAKKRYHLKKIEDICVKENYTRTVQARAKQIFKDLYSRDDLRKKFNLLSHYATYALLIALRQYSLIPPPTLDFLLLAKKYYKLSEKTFRKFLLVANLKIQRRSALDLFPKIEHEVCRCFNLPRHTQKIYLLIESLESRYVFKHLKKETLVFACIYIFYNRDKRTFSQTKLVDNFDVGVTQGSFSHISSRIKRFLDDKEVPTW